MRDYSVQQQWEPYVRRYQSGEWRSTIFRDLVLREIRAWDEPPTVLDIGCGSGFDNEPELQEELAQAAGKYIGVEPDAEMEAGSYFDELHRCVLEDAPLTPGSIHVAFSVYVLEHIPNPERFWNKLHESLVDGGVFWGFTVDKRHFFSKLSMAMEKLKIKDRYLGWLLGASEDGYENYETHYQANSPAEISAQTARFSKRDFLNLHRVGEMEYYLPRILSPFSRGMERLAIWSGMPGPVLAVRLEK